MAPLFLASLGNGSQTTGKLIAAAADAGAEIFNNIAVQDVMIKVLGVPACGFERALGLGGREGGDWGGGWARRRMGCCAGW